VSHRSRSFDDDDYTPPKPIASDDDPNEPTWSSYPDAAHGPTPVPSWVLTSPAAIDEDLGVLKSGKEADVSLVRRTHGDATMLMAVKRYRDSHHRLFHRDSGYLEGRRVKKSREMRAIETRTEFGMEIIASQWAVAEFAVLANLWRAGAAVPYPVQLDGTEVAMEFIGTPDGIAAPRLAQLRPSPREAADLYAQLRAALFALAVQGYAHGDLSAYNVLVHEGRLVLIDLPQAVDITRNPQGFEYLARDCANICAWFDARGIDADARELQDDVLRAMPALH